MFVILTYDINKNKVKIVKKICDRYLHHIQNSVFEGTISEAKLKDLKSKLDKVVNKDIDSICIYKFDSVKYAKKEQIGLSSVFGNII